MKKILLILSTVCCFFAFSATVVTAELELRIFLDNSEIIFPDAKPFTDSRDRVQSPIRMIAESLGADVNWYVEEQKAVLSTSTNELVIYVDKAEYSLNGEERLMDTVAVLQDDRIYVPVRYVAEAFDTTVEWDEINRTVYIRNIDYIPPDEGSFILKGALLSENPGGFVIPDDIELYVRESKNSSDNFVILFGISYTFDNYEKQKRDLKEILSQQFSVAAVKEMINHINTKTKPSDELEEKFIKDTITNQYFGIYYNASSTIELFVFKEGYKPESL